jgi:hypothetical protein
MISTKYIGMDVHKESISIAGCRTFRILARGSSGAGSWEL